MRGPVSHRHRWFGVPARRRRRDRSIGACGAQEPISDAVDPVAEAGSRPPVSRSHTIDRGRA